jgi:hypothetical protein
MAWSDEQTQWDMRHQIELMSGMNSGGDSTDGGRGGPNLMITENTAACDEDSLSFHASMSRACGTKRCGPS